MLDAMETWKFCRSYRNKDTHELEITTNSPVVQKSLEMMSELSYRDFRVVVPMNEIASVRIFHPEAYELFQKEG